MTERYRHLEDPHRYDPPPEFDADEIREREAEREAEDDFRLHQRYDREVGRGRG